MPDRPAYIVTGGAGFVGSNIVGVLLASDPRPRVVVIDTFRTGTFANVVEACNRRGCGPFDGEVMTASTADVNWPGLLADLRPAAVIHEAAITDTTVADEREMIAENLGGFVPLLHACADADIPLAYASSAATYGTPPQARDRAPFPLDAAGEPSNVYGFSKWLMETEHRRLAAEREHAGRPAPRAVGLRYFNVYGPGEANKGKMASMVHQITTQMLDGRSPRLFTDGSQARDQVHVDDVAACTLAAAGFGVPRPPTPGVYNVGSGVATSFNDLVAAVRAGLGISESERPTDYFPMPDNVRRFYQDYTCADISQTARGLGWQPRREPRDAITEYARYLAERRR